MIVVGLTGSVAMGKSTASAMLQRMGVPVHDADAAVHRLFREDGKVISAIEHAFPGSVHDGAIDREALGRSVFHDPDALRRLEVLIHPAVRRDSEVFLRRCARRRAVLAVLDVPLLFETGRDRDCDVTILVSAPAFLQAQRFLRRPGMTRQRLSDIRSRQMPDSEKRRLADYVVRTGLSRRETLRQLMHVVKLLRHRKCRPLRRSTRNKKRSLYA